MSNVARLATQVRVARPTDRLAEVVRFYTEGLGLEEIGRFEGHAGYDGVLIGLPGLRAPPRVHQPRRGQPRRRAEPGQPAGLLPRGPAACWRSSRSGSEKLGREPVEPENPYWADAGALTFEDPDGWRVVLVRTG